ncbi:MAG TPA: AMP-binding protein [Cyclobacteriaceae bacterium]|nr:AMP-binding protein [Cyclobacteriaceae bacterium]
MNSPLEAFLHWEQKTPDKILFKQPLNGQVKTWTYAEAGDEIRRIAAGLRENGMTPGSHVAVLSKNCAEWIMSDLAIMYAGCVSIPIYPTLTAHSIQPILEHSESKMIILGKLDDYSTQKDGVPANVKKLCMAQYGTQDGDQWEDWKRQYEPLKDMHNWKAEDIHTIMYTSGTTGKPKGVMHAIGTFDATVKRAIDDLVIDRNKPQYMFSYLPLSHIAERMGIETVGLYLGVTFSFAESLESFAQNLADTQPTVFFAVPRIWAKFREKIEMKLPPKKMKTLLSIPIINNIIRKSIKKKLGLSRATHIFSGAAPITVDMLQWFDKLGVRILQAYGMTEDCVYAHFNRNDANKHGTVGKPLQGLQVKIADSGEIRVKCPGLTKGYYKEPEMTKELFDEEGYLKTGDMGEIDNQGFLKITGRIKDQFKTDKGKYISPGPIEMKLAANTDIESVCVVGMGVPQPMALVVLSPAGKEKSKEEVIKSITATIDELNPGLEAYEQIEKAVIMSKDWTVENGLMTPTLKVKRNEVEKLYLQTYPAWFNMEGRVVWA